MGAQTYWEQRGASPSLLSGRNTHGFRVRTFMRARRGEMGLSLAAASVRVRIAKGELSMIERGYLLPRAALVERIEQVYGPIETLYPAGVLHVVAGDIRRCPACGEELDPGASKQRRYHEGCR